MSLLFSPLDQDEDGNTVYRLVSAEDADEIQITGHTLPHSRYTYDHDVPLEDDSHLPRDLLKRPEECLKYNDENQNYYLGRAMPDYEYNAHFIRSSFLARDRKG